MFELVRMDYVRRRSQRKVFPHVMHFPLFPKLSHFHYNSSPQWTFSQGNKILWNSISVSRDISFIFCNFLWCFVSRDIIMSSSSHLLPQSGPKREPETITPPPATAPVCSQFPTICLRNGCELPRSTIASEGHSDNDLCYRWSLLDQRSQFMRILMRWTEKRGDYPPRPHLNPWNQVGGSFDVLVIWWKL